MEKKRKAIAALAVWCLLSAAGARGAGEKTDVFRAMPPQKWLTRDTVDFENLQYAGTYTLLFFWQQCAS